MPKGYIQSPIIIIKYNKNRGKGGRAVYARKNISKGSLIEWAPCLMVPADEIGENYEQILPWYAFEWNEQGGKKMNALALGYVSLYNHSYEPNAHYEMDEPDCISIWALHDIVKDEEITINYNGEPADKSTVGFKVNGRGNNQFELPKTKKARRLVKPPTCKTAL